MKKRRALILSLLTLFLVVGIPTGILLRECHHVQVNWALIAAVKADDTNTALAALNTGAEANYPQKENVPRPLWIQWLNRIAGLKAPARELGPSLLAQAVQHNNTILVKALLEKGATDVQGLIVSHQFKDSPDEPIPLLAIAAEAGNLAICQALVTHRADVNQGGQDCALKMAADQGHSEVTRFLFQHGATLDTPDEVNGDCALRGAAASGDAESVRLLLSHGANAKDEQRWGSVLDNAVQGGNLAVVKLVVEAGGNVNGGSAFTNVLQDAAKAGDVEIVRYLLQKGAEVNAKCLWNRTPLLEAVNGNHAAVVQLLLEHGADWRPKVEDDGEDMMSNWEFTQGDTALHLAQRTGNREIIKLLRKGGAKE